MFSAKSPEIEQGNRRVFLRLFEDISEALNKAVEIRTSEGVSQNDIAAKMGADKGFLSRVLSGRSGTNLRTIGAVLFATDCRLKVELVTCEDLKQARYNSHAVPQKCKVSLHVEEDSWTDLAAELFVPKTKVKARTSSHVSEESL